MHLLFDRLFDRKVKKKTNEKQTEKTQKLTKNIKLTQHIRFIHYPNRSFTSDR